MPLDIQIGSLGAEKFNFKIYKNTHWKKYLLKKVPFISRLSAICPWWKPDFGSAELVPAVQLYEVVLPHRGGPRRAAQELG